MNGHGDVQGAVLEGEEGSERLLKYFRYEHLPDHLQAVSRPFCELSRHLIVTLPAGPERTVALRKLLESKDCAVRAALDEPELVVKEGRTGYEVEMKENSS